MSFPELDAFVEECTAIDATLAAVPADAWEQPALGSWTLKELVAHLVRGVTRVTAYLPEPLPDAPVVDRLEYCRFDADAEAPKVAQRAVEEAAVVEAASLPGSFAVGWRASAAAAADHGAAQLLPTFRGPIRLDEYLATRVMEMVVHHLDVRGALDLPEASTPAAARMTMALLEGLLGDARPRNMGRTRFILAATGRLKTDDPRFPVLH